MANYLSTLALALALAVALQLIFRKNIGALEGAFSRFNAYE